MNFTKDELRVIVSMCRHERTLMDTVETMVPGVNVHQGQAIAATIAAKANAMADAMEKAERAEAAKATTKEG